MAEESGNSAVAACRIIIEALEMELRQVRQLCEDYLDGTVSESDERPVRRRAAALVETAVQASHDVAKLLQPRAQ